MPAKKIVIVGDGNAGLSVASQLLHKDKGLDIFIIDPTGKHYYQPAWTLVGAGVYDINKTIRDEKDFIPKGTTWIKEAVEKFVPEENKSTVFNTYKGIVLLWHTKSDLGISVKAIALKPPSISVKFLYPRACKIDAAIILR